MGVEIRPAIRADLPALDAALRDLSAHMGDAHRAGEAELDAALFSDPPAAFALLAEEAGQVVGVAFCSPMFSTVRGGAGVYVNDLWVAPQMRGRGLGKALLQQARDWSAARWGAYFIRLAVYADNPRARAFYEREGFHEPEGDSWLVLDGPALAAL